MKMNKTSALHLSIVCSAAFLIAPSVSAQLVSYDGFETYAQDGLDGDNGGTGWNSAWEAISSANVVSGGLSYSNGSISIDGGDQALSITGSSDNTFLREFDSTGLGNEIYFSFLFSPTNSDASDFYNVFLTNGTATSTNTTKQSPGQIGDLSTSSYNLGARMTRNSGIQDLSGTGYTDGETYLLVGRISNGGSSDPSGANFDLVQLWINPTSTIAGAADAEVDSDAAGAPVGSIVRLGMRSVNIGSGDDYRFDEMRIGSSFESVVTVPEPATYAWIAGITALAGLTIVRRRQR